MPRAWSETEQQRVRQSLLDAGRALFTRHGLAKTSVADLTSAAGIGKGSFYLLFSSKEALFFAIQEDEERRYKAEVEARLASVEATGDGVAVLEAALLGILKLDDHPFLGLLMQPGTIAALQHRVDPEVLEAHRDGDRAWIGGLVQRWAARGLLPAHVDADRVFGVFAGMLALSLQRDLVGPGWEDVFALLARGVARELAG